MSKGLIALYCTALNIDMYSSVIQNIIIFLVFAYVSLFSMHIIHVNVLTYDIIL